MSQSILLPLLFSISKAPCDIAGLSMLAAEETLVSRSIGHVGDKDTGHYIVLSMHLSQG